MDLEQIDPADCPFTLHGEKLAYLSRGRLRMLAKQLGVAPDGAKLELYSRVVTHLEQSGVKWEISEAAEVKDSKGAKQHRSIDLPTQGNAEPKKPAKKATRKPTRRRKATFF